MNRRISLSLTPSRTLPRTQMSEETYRIWCLVEGDGTEFHVVSSPSETVCDLKESIKEMCKNGVLKNVDAKELTLWKVRVTMASDSTADSPAG